VLCDANSVWLEKMGTLKLKKKSMY
jgi:hypothetical protein